jgi:hypothetical protein
MSQMRSEMVHIVHDYEEPADQDTAATDDSGVASSSTSSSDVSNALLVKTTKILRQTQKPQLRALAIGRWSELNPGQPQFRWPLKKKTMLVWAERILKHGTTRNPMPPKIATVLEDIIIECKTIICNLKDRKQNEAKACTARLLARREHAVAATHLALEGMVKDFRW